MKVEILDIVNYPNCVKVRVKVTEGDVVLEEWFGFSHDKFPDGDWKGSIKTWFENNKVQNEDYSSLVGKKFDV